MDYIRTKSYKYYWKISFSQIHIKIYFKIDQQIAQHVGQYSECLYHPLPLLCNSNNQPFSTSSISANHDKGLGV